MEDLTFSEFLEATSDSNWLFKTLSNDDVDPYHWSHLVYTWAEEEGLDNEYGPDDYYEELSDEHKKEFESWLKNNVDRFAYDDPIADQPNRNMNSVRHVKASEWLVHFSDNAYEIKIDGFKYGSDYDGLHLTTMKADKTRKSDGEWAFAFLANDSHARHAARSNRYGDHCVFFQSNAAILVEHYGDGENQVIFKKESATNRVFVRRNQDDGNWSIVSTRQEKDIANIENFDDIATWLKNNFSQYRKQIAS